VTPSDEIFGLDVASTMGVCEGVPGQTPRLYTVRLAAGEDDHGASFAKAIKWMAQRLLVTHPRAIIIEAPIPAAAMNGATNANTLAVLWGLAACIEGTARAKSIPVRRVNIQRVRKSFIGAGNLKGPEAKRRTVALCRALGWNPPSHDAADAAACWHLGCTMFAPDLAHWVDPLLIGLNERGEA
jgi:hypothetical protein